MSKSAERDARDDVTLSAREVAMKEALQKIADDYPRLTNEGAQKWARDALAYAATLLPEPAAVPEGMILVPVNVLLGVVNYPDIRKYIGTDLHDALLAAAPKPADKVKEEE
jgi:hypothetical protein